MYNEAIKIYIGCNPLSGGQMKLSTLTTAIILTSISSLTFAATYKDAIYKDAAPCIIPTLHDGFYTGVQAGYDSFRIPTTTTGAPGSFRTTGSLAGWMGGLFLGYGRYFNPYSYLGAEILGNYNGSTQTISSGMDDDGDTFNRNVKVKATLGISLLPGLKLNNASLGYLRLGYDWTNFHLNSTATAAGLGTFSTSRNSTLGGFDFGLGIETLLCQKWSVRTEYNHIWYTSSSSSVGGVNTSINPSDNQFTLGAVYHFV